MCYRMCSDIMHASCGACMQASQPPLCKHGMPEITYGHAVCTSQTTFKKTNCLTFKHPKYENCKPEHAENDSHCHAQSEQG